MLTLPVSDSLTRPDNTTQYAAGDVVTGDPVVRLSFAGIAAYGNPGGEIRSAVIRSSAAQATKPDLELWLFSSDPTSLDADNGAWTPTDAELASLLGIIPFAVANWKAGDATSGVGGNAVCVVANVGILLTAETVYGVLIARNAYDPIAEEEFSVSLAIALPDR